MLNTTLTKEVPDDMDQLLEKHNLRSSLAYRYLDRKNRTQLYKPRETIWPPIDSRDRHSYETVDLALTEERLFNAPLRADTKETQLESEP